MNRAERLAIAQDRRMAIADLRRRMVVGEDSVEAVLRRREPLLAHLALCDVVRFRRAKRSYVGDPVRQMGAAAVRDGINLLVDLGGASERSVEWTARWVENHPVVAGVGKRR